MNPKKLLATFANRLAYWRSTSGLTQAELARKAGVCTSYVSMLERGQRNPPLTTIAKLARVLAVPPAALLLD